MLQLSLFQVFLNLYKESLAVALFQPLLTVFNNLQSALGVEVSNMSSTGVSQLNKELTK